MTTPARYDSPTASDVFEHLQIDNRHERQLVGAADLALTPWAAINAWRQPASDDELPPKRVLLFRLERNRRPSDDARCNRRHPGATTRRGAAAGGRKLERDTGALHAGGGRGGDVRRDVALPRTARIDATGRRSPNRRPGGVTASTWRSTSSRTSGATRWWRPAGARRRIGYASGGGGAFLTDTLDYDRTIHSSANAQRLGRTECCRPSSFHRPPTRRTGSRC